MKDCIGRSSHCTLPSSATTTGSTPCVMTMIRLCVPEAFGNAAIIRAIVFTLLVCWVQVRSFNMIRWKIYQHGHVAKGVSQQHDSGHLHNWLHFFRSVVCTSDFTPAKQWMSNFQIWKIGINQLCYPFYDADFCTWNKKGRCQKLERIDILDWTSRIWL